MKGMTIALAVLLLMMGAGTARAASETLAGDGVVAIAGQVASEPDAEANSATFYLVTSQDFIGSGDAGLLADRTLNLWGYEIGSQMSIDLGFRPSGMAVADFDPMRNGVGVKQLAHNLMVGFHYQF